MPPYSRPVAAFQNVERVIFTTLYLFKRTQRSTSGGLFAEKRRSLMTIPLQVSVCDT